jgi:hypothetical protein
MLHAQVKETNFSLKDRNNSVYFEALGNGGLFSINYERTVLKKDNIRGFLRAGASEWHSEDTDKLDVGVIGEAGVLIGGSHHFFDCGLGITLWTKDLERFVVPRIGYRYTGKKGLLIRVSPAMFIINSEPDSFGGYWIGIALGYGF